MSIIMDYYKAAFDPETGESNGLTLQQYIIDKSIVLYNQILPFIQYYIAYETLFRIESKAYKFLDLKNYILYRDVIQNLLYQTDEKFILEQKIFPSRLQIFALSKKYNRDNSCAQKAVAVMCL